MIHLIVIDTETGGLDPSDSCIIELAARCVTIAHERKGLTVGESFHELVKPDRPVGAQAATVNGYSEEKWSGSKRMGIVARKFIGWLYTLPHEDMAWAGSNVSGFDLPFLKSDLARCDLALPGKPKFGRRVLNTESLCFPLLVRGDVNSLGVEALRTWAGLSGKQKHTALDDVHDTVAIVSRYFYKEVWGI